MDREDLEREVERRTAGLRSANRELLHEVEERRRAEAELRRLNETLEQRVEERTRELQRSQTLEAMGRLAGGVAHDFNNLLGGVLGCLYTIRLHGGDNPALTAELEQAQQLCKRGGKLTAQLLAVARQGGGRVEPIDGRRLLEDLGALLERTLPLHLRFRMELNGTLPVVRAVRVHLHTAILNLVLNARDAMPEGGTLTLRSWVAGGAWFIEVADTGIGIAPNLQERVFEPFYTTKDAGEGAGLGLSLVYATAEELGGEVRLSSVAGQGATFALVLPTVDRESIRAAGSEARAGPHSSGGAVLLVEDKEPVARMVVDALEQRGYRVLTAGSGTDALDLLSRYRDEVTLILLDLVLPGVSADSIYRLLRVVAPEIAVVFATGREDLARRLDPTVPILTKPFTDTELLAAVASVFGPDAGEIAE